MLKAFGSPIMIMGCTSDAGKSWLCAVLCRYLQQQGINVAPFKAQNMSNNAAVTTSGGEIGRAQFFQAFAAKQVATIDMNPVLLKPQSDMTAQVVVHGKIKRELNAIDWHQRKSYLWGSVQQSLTRLQEQHQLLVIEGAGSPAEVNLRHSDIVNMEVALAVQAKVYLVVDIDRGGAYAHLLGTWHCLSPDEQALVKGFVINKFRGEQSLLEPANQWIEEQTGVPIVAVIPWLKHKLPEEDNFFHNNQWQVDQVNIALIRYPFASNLDEFDPLFYEEGVNVVPVSTAQDLTKFSAIILPGSKHVTASLTYLRQQKLDAAIQEAAKQGIEVLGICGGLQLMGEHLNDPEGYEGGNERGLGLLPLSTDYQEHKQCVQAKVRWQQHDLAVYEIHQGQTHANEQLNSFIATGKGWQQDNCKACYYHDLFANKEFRQWWLSRLAWQGKCNDWLADLDAELERLTTELSPQLANLAHC